MNSVQNNINHRVKPERKKRLHRGLLCVTSSSSLALLCGYKRGLKTTFIYDS